jgi:hypothetical protein
MSKKFMEQPYKDQAPNVEGHKQRKNPSEKPSNAPLLVGAKHFFAFACQVHACLGAEAKIIHLGGGSR